MFVTKGDIGLSDRMLAMDLERGERGVRTGVITGVVVVEGSGVLKEKIDPLDERFGEGLT